MLLKILSRMKNSRDPDQTNLGLAGLRYLSKAILLETLEYKILGHLSYICVTSTDSIMQSKSQTLVTFMRS